MMRLLCLFLLGSMVVSATDALPLARAEHWYFNATDEGLALNGYDVVAYFTEGEAKPGDTAISAEYGGLTYRFADEAHRDAFRAAPEQYLPQYGGFCAYGCSLRVEDRGWAPARYPVDPTAFRIIAGKLYLFNRSPAFDALKSWESEDQAMQVARADAWWQSRIAPASKGLPEGMHPRAPIETARFAFLLGKWKNEVRWMNDTEKRTYGPAIEGIWEAEFGWDGFAINDIWRREGLPGSGGPAWRYVDRRSGRWVMIYIPIGQPGNQIWIMDGEIETNGEVIGRFEGTDPRGRAFVQKVFFYDIEANSFLWRADRSYDGGETWIEGVAVATNTRIE